MKRPAEWLDASMIAISAILGVGSIALLAAMDSIRVFRTGWPVSSALFWDAALSFAFFLQHSGMVRRPFRARLSRIVPRRYDGALYSIASGVVLTLVVVLWTAWICAGAVLEERDLVTEFGEAYREYRRKVPMLVPWRGPAAS